MGLDKLLVQVEIRRNAGDLSLFLQSLSGGSGLAHGGAELHGYKIQRAVMGASHFDSLTDFILQRTFFQYF